MRLSLKDFSTSIFDGGGGVIAGVAVGEGTCEETEVINVCDGLGDSIAVGDICSRDFTDAKDGARLVETDIGEYEETANVVLVFSRVKDVI